MSKFPEYPLRRSLAEEVHARPYGLLRARPGQRPAAHPGRCGAGGTKRDLPESMDKRAKLLLRLQETVEGLSVVAVSYYLLGLVAYAAKSAKAFGLDLLQKSGESLLTCV